MFRSHRFTPFVLAALLAAALWLPAAPATAVPSVAAAAPGGPGLVQLAWSVHDRLARALAAWGFLPAGAAKEGAGMDPNGDPTAAVGPGMDPNGGPTAAAGPGMDPNGGLTTSGGVCGDAGPGMDPLGNPCNP